MDHLDLLADLVSKAQTAGADAADAVYVEGVSLSLGQRLGKQERLERSENFGIGLRVLINRRQAIVSSSDISSKALTELVDRSLSMARAVPQDPYCGLADPDQLATKFPHIDSLDATEPSAETLTRRAAEAEDAALAVTGVSNSEEASATWSRKTFAMAASNGFAQLHESSRHGVVVSVIAGKGTAMETDYDYASAVYGADLPSPAEIGRAAGKKAVARLNPRKAASAKAPIIYDPRVSCSIVGHLSGAINGQSVARGASFLKNDMGKRLFSENVAIIDDPHRKRGLSSRPFDGEGIGTMRRNIINKGVLTTWFLDLRSGRQLGLPSTGHAGRSLSSPPSPVTSNLYLDAGAASPEDLMADIDSGLYVTDLMGFGVNQVTGDYSRGASGFWIQGGKLTYPVSEITIAGNLRDMFANLTPANDLQFRYGVNAPTLRIDGMTVAGT